MKKAEFVKNISKMKAPPMLEVANQLKSQILIKDDDEDIHRQVVILFTKNYIENPNLDYSLCNPGAIERFGIEPFIFKSHRLPFILVILIILLSQLMWNV